MPRTSSSRRRLSAGIAIPATIRTSTRAPLLQVVKTAAAMILAWTVATIFVHGELPIFATIAALLVVQPSVNQSVGRAVERSLGVIVGTASPNVTVWLEAVIVSDALLTVKVPLT